VAGTCGDNREPDSEDGEEPEDDGGQEGADRLSILRQVLWATQLLQQHQDHEQQQQQSTGANRMSTASSSTPAAAAAAAAAVAPRECGSNTIHLPMDALLSIVTRLDAPTAARAAAACQQLYEVASEVETFSAASPGGSCRRCRNSGALAATGEMAATRWGVGQAAKQARSYSSCLTPAVCAPLQRWIVHCVSTRRTCNVRMQHSHAQRCSPPSLSQ
jgi:hypothetical protein